MLDNPSLYTQYPEKGKALSQARHRPEYAGIFGIA
jgi:hypothetical protein